MPPNAPLLLEMRAGISVRSLLAEPLEAQLALQGRPRRDDCFRGVTGRSRFGFEWQQLLRSGRAC